MRLIISEGSSIENRSGTSKKSGLPYSMNVQPGRIRFGNGEVRNVEIDHKRADDAPMAAGEYAPKDSAFYMGKYGPEVSLKPQHWERVEAPAVRKVG